MSKVSSLDLISTTVIAITAESVLSTVLYALGVEAGGRTGGFLRVFLAMDSTQGPKGWHEVCASRVGSQKEESAWEKYQVVSMEKAIRLMKWHARAGHVSSWQSRNEKMWEYGGAFILEVFIPEFRSVVKILVSFSGLPERGDEALGLLTVKGVGWAIHHGDHTRVTEHSGNKLANTLLDVT